jgi:hypothetical protein
MPAIQKLSFMGMVSIKDSHFRMKIDTDWIKDLLVTIVQLGFLVFVLVDTWIKSGP